MTQARFAAKGPQGVAAKPHDALDAAGTGSSPGSAARSLHPIERLKVVARRQRDSGSGTREHLADVLPLIALGSEFGSPLKEGARTRQGTTPPRAASSCGGLQRPSGPVDGPANSA
jgi:hypothetical protein